MSVVCYCNSTICEIFAMILPDLAMVMDFSTVQIAYNTAKKSYGNPPINSTTSNQVQFYYMKIISVSRLCRVFSSIAHYQVAL